MPPPVDSVHQEPFLDTFDQSSSESSSDNGSLRRQRAPKFKPGPAEANAIYYQLCKKGC
jgi:hypothetical protein